MQATVLGSGDRNGVRCWTVRDHHGSREIDRQRWAWHRSELCVDQRPVIDLDSDQINLDGSKHALAGCLPVTSTGCSPPTGGGRTVTACAATGGAPATGGGCAPAARWTATGGFASIGGTSKPFRGWKMTSVGPRIPDIELVTSSSAMTGARVSRSL